MQMAQSVPIDIHYHHAWLVWLLFFCGEILHVALQADDMARKAEKSRWALLCLIWPKIAFRVFCCAMIFAIIWGNPELIAKIPAIFGHPIGVDESEVLAVPMNNAIAGLYGLFLDSLLGYIPVLKSQLPNLNS